MEPVALEIVNDVAEKVGTNLAMWAGRKIFNRLFRRSNDSFTKITETDELDKWRSRVDTVLQELQGGIDDLQQADKESREPAAQRFADDALLSAIESPSEQKRAILGRLIVRRLQSKTESFYELQLREARKIAADTSENQLACLATIMLLFHTPAPLEESELHKEWFSETLRGAVRALSKSTWTRSDLDHLVTVGALSHNESMTRTSLFGRGFIRFREETLDKEVHKLIGMSFDQRGPSLLPYWLNSAGAVLAAAILERLFQRRIYFPEWENRKFSDLASSDLVAPFDSNRLTNYERMRNEAAEHHLRRMIEDNAPSAVAEDMRRNSRRIR